MTGWRRSAAAGLLLLAIYVGLSFLNSPRGFLGTDTGGKVATMKVMTERGRFDPDLGYWAEEWDPEGKLHPIALTSSIGHRWVNVTTLPALWVGWQLYRVGGYRASLLVPMAGSIAAAFAAVALARALGAERRWAEASFWIIGLASPMAIYALDFWEHSLGVALLAWSVVLVLEPRSLVRVTGAGALAGAAATMRTEALVYAAVIGAVLFVAGISAGAVRTAVARSGLFGATAIALFGVGALFERQVLASSIRPARAAGTALDAGAAASTRLEEALVTTVGFGGRPGIALGAALTVLVVLSTWPRLRRSFPLLASASLLGASASYLVVLASGLGFVPGIVPTAPISAVAERIPQARRVHLVVLAIALAAVPVVLVFQFVGGAGPQWGGRYLLPSSFLLLVAGWVRLGGGRRRIAGAFVAISVVITGFGLVWLQVRSHQVERAIAAIDRRPEAVVVSSLGHLAREGGASYGERRWLTRYPGATAEGLRAVLDGAGVSTVATVELATAPAVTMPGFRAVDRSRLRLFRGADLRITSWRRTG